MWVWEDPRIDGVAELLPGANCGACGFAGCRAFAEATVTGAATPAQCTVMGADMVDDVASFLGVDAGSATKRVARLLCAGGSDVAPHKADYVGIIELRRGRRRRRRRQGLRLGLRRPRRLRRGVHVRRDRHERVGLPVVDIEKCTACGDCVDACPLDLFTIMPLDHHLVVQCRNLLSGDAATDVCAVACNACGRCVQDAAPGLIEIRRGLAVIDYDRIILANEQAIARCPTGAITWLEGAQFEMPQRGGVLI
jgi:Na+-translocating ferredoxin:NAD+ oxidoreductase subunit B